MCRPATVSTTVETFGFLVRVTCSQPRLRRRVVVMDPSFNMFDPEDSTHNILMRKEITLLKEEFNNVLQTRIADWNTQIMDWEEESMSCSARR